MPSDDKNVLGGALSPCSMSPRTRFYRDGCCDTGAEDLGLHVVCAEVTAEFLRFARSRGNDLITPAPELGCPGLKPGDRHMRCHLARSLRGGCRTAGGLSRNERGNARRDSARCAKAACARPPVAASRVAFALVPGVRSGYETRRTWCELPTIIYGDKVSLSHTMGVAYRAKEQHAKASCDVPSFRRSPPRLRTNNGSFPEPRHHLSTPSDEAPFASAVVIGDAI